ncbi:sensor histidine kinase [Staphylococcus felis]|uniref:sensor histidine kinase n=1 Tax=Staphylococcus felis TaxID=46127 RepID=UPI000E25AD5E|nr:sensor histidine kinase [Staphylococcus felis]REI06412.1 sensor histidine kinase [Staphylococcus felis]
MKKLDLNLGNLASLAYLLFPIISLVYYDNRGSVLILTIITGVFSIAYTILIIGSKMLSNGLRFNILVIHYLGIIYFVYAIHPTTSLFLFYSAFALPFSFKVLLWSKEYVAFLITMIACLSITYVFYSPSIFMMLVVFYLIINLMMFSNFKTVEKAEYKERLEEKNKYINVLIANQERNRIGQDLHDTLGHVFASLSLKSELAIKLIDQNKYQAKAEMIEVNRLSKEALTEIRAIVHNLKIQSFEEEVASLEYLLKTANLKFHFENVALSYSMSPTKQSFLAMILREAINNVIKHADATEVRASLSQDSQGIILKICDNGKGSEQPNIHLQSIQNRVDLLGGELEVRNHNGLHIYILIPRGVQS